MRNVFPKKAKGQTISAAHLDALSVTSRRSESMMTASFGHGRDNISTGLVPSHQRIMAVTAGSSSLRPATTSEITAEDDNRVLARYRYFDRTEKKWKTSRGNDFFVDDGMFGVRLEEGDEFTGIWDQQRGRFMAIPNYLPVGIIPIKNETEGDLLQNHVVGLGDPITLPRSPADPEEDDDVISTQRFQDKIAFTGKKPSDPDHVGKFGVVLRDIKDTKIGWACLSGVIAVRIEVADEKHNYAEIVDDCVENLQSVECGSAQILWKDSSDQDYAGGCASYGYTGSEDYYGNQRWAIIRMSNYPCDVPEDSVVL